ncbi:MAG: TetR/AcrR family transcriptional regulator [Deltaproteobacteria bacterium]|nr:TetR/AcrR family transcriptional regulator [Deltaproteobacteria bacterium]
MPQSNSASDETEGVRDRILDAAREELALRGFQASSVRTIGENAGVTAAMINYYFGGKRALYDAVVAEAQGRLHARLGAALAEGPSAPRLAGAYFDFLAEEPQMQRLLLREVLDGGVDQFPEMLRPLRALLTEHFGGDRAVHAALSLFGAIAGYFIYEPVLGELLGEDPLSPDALARRRSHIIELASKIEELSS